MISVAHTWLMGLLAAADVPGTRVFTDAASLSGNDPVPKAVLLVGEERVKRIGQKAGASTAPDGKTRSIRMQLWERRLPVMMRLELESQARCETVVDAILATAFLGPDDNGNRWAVKCQGIAWPEEKSRLVDANRVRVDLALEFVGGVYRDRVVPLVTNVMPAPAPRGG